MKRWLCGALAALMALTTGCSAILNRDYTSVTPHSATPQADGESKHHPGGELPGAGERPDLPHRPGNRGGSHPL